MSSETKTTKKPFLTLQSKKKKKKKKPKADANSNKEYFASDDGHYDDSDQQQLLDEQHNIEPLVIPVAQDTSKWNNKNNDNNEANAAAASDFKNNEEEEEAIRALNEQASSGGGGGGGNISKNKDRVIPVDQQDHAESQQYKTDLEQLPSELEITSTAYQQVPIAEFGAALLRGMGWKDDDDKSKKKSTTKKQNDDGGLPRPHRLGLGAVPKAVMERMDAAAAADAPPSHSRSRRGKRPDQYERDQALAKQQEVYRQERERQLAVDKQRTLQNGSLVRVLLLQQSGSGHQKQQQRQQRARIVQLVGVPGLNMAKVQLENTSESSVIQRKEIDGLLTRQELEERPFQEPKPPSRPETESTTTTNRKEQSKPSERQRRRRSRDDDDDRNGSSSSKRRGDRSDDRRREEDDDVDRERSSKKRKRKVEERGHDRRQQHKQQQATWLIPNIRVRVITKKLGKQYYKEKGIVMDVTPKGATLQLSNSMVLDRVPERYLETALPKSQDGVVVVLQQQQQQSSSESLLPQHAIGRILERNSRQAVVQALEDKTVSTLSLDDIAEWCGPVHEI